MTGIETALLISQLAGPLMSMLGGGGDVEGRQSFEGMGSISPQAMMHTNQDLLSRLMGAATERAGQPISLSSATQVQQPGAFTGGGMPFPIGLVAQDPALGNPSLLNRPGLGEYQNIMTGLGGGGGVEGGSVVPGSGYTSPIDTPRRAVPRNQSGADVGGGGGEDPSAGGASAASPAPRQTAPRQTARRSSIADGDYGQLVRASDLELTTDFNPGDDLKQAMGAVDLLLQAYGGNV